MTTTQEPAQEADALVAEPLVRTEIDIEDARCRPGLNVVPHRHNLDAVAGLIEPAVAWDAERIELANTQFYGWGLLNRAALMPTRDQLARAVSEVESLRTLLGSGLDITWVVPDHFSGTPKPCMGGWGSVSLTVTPDGTTLPCPAAAALPELAPPSVLDRPLRWIWEESPAFNRYRGTDWLPSPCRTCDRRGLRRLPLPGIRPHRRLRAHRPRLRSLPRPPDPARSHRAGSGTGPTRSATPYEPVPRPARVRSGTPSSQAPPHSCVERVTPGERAV
ncbi:SPASM domain-containing protein [Streptomyces sp. NBC_00647]|uniref:SPASM domain-containing protein n=1 Tax=Streptomyces sp. NBC_00647 TaxID=2975796 RepID=UPI003864AE2F